MNCLAMWLVATLLLVVASGVRYELRDYSPAAQQGETWHWMRGTVRVTVLTDRLFRVEHDPKGRFEDRPTLAFVNRNLGVVFFSVTNSTEPLLTVTTKYATLEIGANMSSLSVSSVAGDFPTWRFGASTEGNLMGTIRSLDLLRAADLNCSANARKRVHGEELHCAWAPISRRGVAVIDDSANWCLRSDFSFWESPNQNELDLYIFAYGSRYKEALAAFSAVSGNAAMPLRSSLGIMHSRWFNYDSKQVREVVETYRERSIPLDVLVLDMDWHFKYGWGAYSWDRNNFPVPEDTLAFLKESGLVVGANLHDNSGVIREEERYEAMRKAIGWSSNTTVPFKSCSNQTFAFALEDVVWRPLGFDIPWIDWQQGGDKGGCTDGAHNPTMWLNRLRGTDNFRNNDTARATILSRWGGLGSHRYPLGFSGDVLVVDWSDLAYQPYFSLTASNVLFAWSHDIVGPHADSNHELNVRWIQWGAFSSLFRTHDRGYAEGVCADFNICSNVEIYDLPRPFYGIARDAVVQRSRLVPYIYSAFRELFDSGVSLLRPMYYDWPLYDEAYLTDAVGSYSQYMFGPDMLVAPVVSKADDRNGLAEKSIWLPPGCWVAVDFGTVVCSNNGTIVKNSYDLSEIPRYIRGNAMLPCSAGISVAASPLQRMELDVYADAADGDSETLLYEDDGATTAYVDSESFAFTSIQLVASGGKISIQINAPNGTNFAALPKLWLIRLFNAVPPASVASSAGAVTWRYNARLMAVEITAPTTVTELQLTYVPSSTSLNIAGLAGKMKRAQMAKEVLDRSGSTPGSHLPTKAALSQLASLPQLLSSLANNNSFDRFAAVVSSFGGMWNAALDEVKRLEFDPVALPFWAHAYTLLTTAQ